MTEITYRNRYGYDLGAAGWRAKFSGPVTFTESKPNATAVAEIIGWREGPNDYEHSIVVVDEYGKAILNPEWSFAIWWPDADKPGSRPNVTNSNVHPVASTYTLAEALRLSMGNMNQDSRIVDASGGPYESWIDGADLECPRWRWGWAGDGHSIPCPIIRVRYKSTIGGVSVPPTPTDPAAGSMSQDADFLITVAQRLRSGYR